MKSSIKIRRGQIENVYKSYTDIADFLGDQSNQSPNRLYKIIDASADPNLTFPSGETRKYAYYEYNGTPTADLSDYTLISAPYGNGGSELTPDEIAGIQNGNGLNAMNPVATMDDLPNLEPIPINLFIQYSESSIFGDSAINLIQPDLGLPILEIEDLQEDSSYSGELVLDYENNNIETNKVIELFGAEIYNNTNPSADITAKITFTLNFFNQVGDDIDYKLSWEYLSSGDILFGEHTGTIDNTSNVDFELRALGHSTDIFNLKKARLWRN